VIRVLQLIFLIAIHVTTWAQNYTVTIIDAQNQQVVRKAKVIAEWQNNENRLARFIYLSNDQGIADIEEEAIKNNASFTISAEGYLSVQMNAVQIIDKQYKILLEPGNLKLEEVTISASKFKESTNDVSKQILAIPSREINRLNPLNSADLLEKTGQVFVQRSQLGGGSPVLRGFEANKVLLVIDGLRMNNAIYRGGHLQNILRVHPLLTERVEVVFGAGSVVYGSDALGGVIHITTTQPQFSQGNKPHHSAAASVGYQSAAQAFQNHLQYTISGKRLASLTGVSFSQFGDLRQGNYRESKWGNLGLRDSFQIRTAMSDEIAYNPNNAVQKSSAYEQIDAMQKIRFAINKYWELGVNLQYSNTGNVPRYDRLSEVNATSGRLRFAEWYYGPELRTLAAVSLTGKNKTALYDEWRTTVSYQYIEESRHNRNFNAPNRTSRLEKVDVFAVNTDAQLQWGKNEIRYGTEYQYNYVASSAQRLNVNTGAISAQSTRYPDGGSNMQTLAAYVNNTREINTHWVINTGLRISAISLMSYFKDRTFVPFLETQPILKQYNTNLTYHAGVIYIPLQSVRLYANYSTGFRAPNVDDVGKVFESVGNVQVVIPNPNLKSEYTHQFETGITLQPEKFIYWQQSMWYTLLNNAITLAPASFFGNDSILFQNQKTRVVSQQNVQSAYLYGYSSNLRIILHKNAHAYSTFNFTYGRIKTDSTPYPLDHIPPIYGRTGLIYSVSRFTIDGYVLYQGAKHLKDYNLFGEDNLQYATPEGMPSWYTFNITGSVKLTNKRLNLTLISGIENITDNYYRVFASGISGAGRNVFITLRANY
jgi:hemoglobin/transferrin/lactoferrin receptor protein